MDLKIQFGNPRNISPGDLDGIIIRFPFTVTYIGKGARKDEVKQHRIDVGISGALYSMWGFGRLFEREQPISVIKTLFQFAKDEVENKLKTGTLSEHEEIMLSTSELKENPYNIKKIKYPSESSFVITIQESDTIIKKAVNEKNPMVPDVFISYSWDNDPHREWVRQLAERLRADGANVILDQWHLAPGDQMTDFMERAVRENDLVLIICTTRFKQKSDNRAGGVGYEGDIMTAEVLSKNNHRKFIPILREKPWKDVAPSWLLGKVYIDLSGEPYSEEQYNDLVATVHNQRPSPPPVGSRPTSKTTLKSSYKQEKSIPQIDQPIAIEGVVIDEVTSPKNDGSAGSALYAIPFKLTRRPSATWASAFIQAWDKPSRFSTMHRPGIARVSGDKIILDGTTIEEVEKNHRDTLKLAVERANIIEKQRIEEEIHRKEKEEKRAAEHKQIIDDVSKRLRFD